MVSIADYANRNGLDGDKVGQTHADAVKGLSPEERKRYNDAFIGVATAKPGDVEEAKKRFHSVQDDIAKKHPEKREPFGKHNDALEKKKDEQRAEAAKTQEKVATVEVKRDGNDDLMSSLNDKPAVVKKAEAAPETKDGKAVKVAASQPKTKGPSPTA